MIQALKWCFVGGLQITCVSCKGLEEEMLMLLQYSSLKPVLWCLVNIMARFE